MIFGQDHPNQNTHQRRPYLSSSAFLSHASGSTDNGTGGIMDSREPPVHMPTGTPRSSSTILLDLGLHQSPGDPGQTTTPGTTTPRDQHSRRHRMSLDPEHPLNRRPGHINGFPDIAVRAESHGSPQGSTVVIVFPYAATATPAVRVLFISGPQEEWTMDSFTTGNSRTAKPAYETVVPTLCVRMLCVRSLFMLLSIQTNQNPLESFPFGFVSLITKGS